MTFPHTITLIPAVKAESELGGTNYVYPGPGTSYQAFVQTRNEYRAEILNTGGSREMTVVYVPGLCPASQLDRIEYDGVTYEVNGVILARSLTGVHHTKIMTQMLEQTQR